MRDEGTVELFPARAAEDSGDRFEFRVFRRQLGPEAVILAAIAGAGRLEFSVDRYVIVPGRADVGLKLRGGTLELKRLTRIVGGLEQWHPEATIALPAAGRDLAPLLLALDLPTPRAEQVFPDAGALADWLVEGRGVSVTTLRKRRQLFLLPEGRAELGRVSWDGPPLRTLAIESADANAVAALVARVGLTGAANTSYPRLLCEQEPG